MQGCSRIHPDKIPDQKTFIEPTSAPPIQCHPVAFDACGITRRQRVEGVSDNGTQLCHPDDTQRVYLDAHRHLDL